MFQVNIKVRMLTLKHRHRPGKANLKQLQAENILLHENNFSQHSQSPSHMFVLYFHHHQQYQ